MKQGQKGFGVVEGLLGLIVIGLVGFIGWYVYDTKNSTDLTDNKRASTSAAANTSLQKSYKYLSIPERSVKVRLSSVINDAYYLVPQDNPNNFVYLDTRKLNSLKSCGELSSIASLAWARPGDKNIDTENGEPWTEAALEATPHSKIGDTYYFILSVSAPCTYDSVNNSFATQANAKSVSTAFIQASVYITKL